MASSDDSNSTPLAKEHKSLLQNMQQHDTERIASQSMSESATANPDLGELNGTLNRLCDDLKRLTAKVEASLNGHSLSMSQLKHLRGEFHEPTGKFGSAETMLKTLKNYLCPASALPPDIWRHIFHLTIAQAKIESKGTPNYLGVHRLQTNYSRLATLATVCRYWHDICVQTPSLWSCVIWRTSPLQEQVLRCHRAMPLDISLRGHGVPKVLLEPSNVRCRALEWSQCTEDSITKEGWLLALSGEVLEDLTLSCHEVRASERPETPMRIMLFGDSTPHLRSVSLCGLTWAPKNRFITVTQLLIGHSSWSHPISTILDLLSGTPQLVDLVLSGMLSEQQEVVVLGGARKVHLRNLRRLCFHNTGTGSHGIVSFFPALVVAPQTVVLVNNESATFERWTPEILLPFDLSPTTMQLRFHLTPYSYREVGRLQFSIIAASQHCGIILTRKSIVPAHQGYRFANIIDLSQIQHLRYFEALQFGVIGGSPPPPWASWVWSSILPELSALERLTIFGRSLPDIAKALDGDGLVRMQQGLCPRLSRIVVLLSHRDPLVEATMAKLVTIRERLQFSCVTIGYLSDYRHERWYQQSEDYLFDSVEYADYERVPGMKTSWPDQSDLPALPSAYWPEIETYSSQMLMRLVVTGALRRSYDVAMVSLPEYVSYVLASPMKEG
ncbi:uncharacterized protein B0H18DRAFT_1116448 [Fomitopsis serialis]|uniref:uncharacterized protein n=1 Tax=Fomitopsis serialis TaxID=139415 RepID=UPI0020084A20|nr:uncharacterized protein B0H18DRAFT_1116448 [Neoantrodia serialis]KAH9931286.1 hypothetical protein B0H18DRAFT_1116448 [Neoantrodia serialis]